jgi:uncharacterized protein YdeI (BOF family)
MTEPTGNSRKSILGLGTAVLFCAAMAFTPGVTPRVHAAPAPATTTSAGTDDAAVQTFTGKIMSQNGDRFILRDDSTDVWYHLDNQQEAGKFLGKDVQVTGTLDGRSDMIHVRNIAENKTENHN